MAMANGATDTARAAGRDTGHDRRPGGELGRRRLPIGAELLAAGGAHSRVGPPRRRSVEVVFDVAFDGPPGTSSGRSRGASLRLEAEGGGYFSGLAPEARAGTLYRFRLDGGDSL